jgi:hypothetical protein
MKDGGWKWRGGRQNHACQNTDTDMTNQGFFEHEQIGTSPTIAPLGGTEDTEPLKCKMKNAKCRIKKQSEQEGDMAMPGMV